MTESPQWLTGVVVGGGDEETFPGGENSLYLECGGGDCKTMSIYQNS